MTVSRARGAKAKADALFSKIVRARGACEKCGESNYSQLQTAHIISRGYNNTRVELDNAFCLCASDHRYFTSHPVAFAAFVIEKMGQAAYEDLHARSLPSARKVDWEYEAARLKDIWAGIEAAA